MVVAFTERNRSGRAKIVLLASIKEPMQVPHLKILSKFDLLVTSAHRIKAASTFQIRGQLLLKYI